MTNTPRAGVPRVQVRGAWLLLSGFTAVWLGVAWDGQWHIDVGPDTFFTAPHLLFYAGTALVGLTALGVVLAATRDSSHQPVGPDRHTITVLRHFRAPLPFLVAGLGAAGHLLYGTADLWWHTIYGFDILELTPPHVSLQLAMQVQAIGLVMAFAALRGSRSGRWGLAAAGALGVAAGALLLDGEVFGIRLTMLGVSGVAVWTMGVVAGIVAGVASPARWVSATGLLFLVVFGATMLFPPFATETYADAINQPFRDNALRISILGIGLPMAFPLIAALTAAAVRFARGRDLPPNAAMMAVGALAGPATALQIVAFDDTIERPVLNLLIVAVVGAAVCRLGWHGAALLRGSSPRQAQ